MKCSPEKKIQCSIVLLPWSISSSNIEVHLREIRQSSCHCATISTISDVHPCEKVIGMFFQNQFSSRFLDINGLCLVCIKRSIEKVKKCQISKRSYQQGPSDETSKRARCQFCRVKFGHRIMKAVNSFDDKMGNFTQITFNFMNRWIKCVVSWFSCIILHKWYVSKLYTIK